MADLDLNAKLEKKLDDLLNPVTPSSSYITDLQKKLLSKADVTVEYPNYLMIVIILGSGLALGLGLVFILNHILRKLTGKKSNDQ